ncbi:MFS transporter [Sharpea azabuensis]|uniref:Predicted arabinose efflux permease, MFS family n=1 Tax=Sharpea azabuensis TaxID=322505 RepID=A0A1H6WR89_9FIRM|nr:MFS transporter [Sharpea azabuensis]SEJ14875.1 Predicted arabinose efflux permease, MFS family [Sharpea azabuensis]
MNTKNIKIAVSIFLTAFAFGLNITGITPVLGILNEKYHAYGTSMVQLLQTLPYFLIMVGSLTIGYLTTKISKKKIIILGLFIIGICGILPYFTDSFTILFISRLLIGFGFGITGPMNTAIVADFIEPENRAGFMGLHVVGMGVGAMMGNLLGGAFSGLGYKYFYLVYLAAFIAIVGVMSVLEEKKPTQGEKVSDMKMTRMVWVLSIASFVHTLFITTYNTNIGIYLVEQFSSGATLTGIVTAINSAFALVCGMMFSKISGFLKKYTLPFSILAAAMGYAILLFVPGMVGVYIASALCGISLSCFMAIANYLLTISVEKEAVAKASGLFAIVGGIGGLIAPLFMGGAARIFLGVNTAQNQFMIAFVGMLLFGIITLIAVRKKFANHA